MNGTLVALFGLLPLVILVPGALTVFGGGITMLFDEPALGALFAVWGAAGLAGTVALVRVANGTYTNNTVPGLLAGIGAAAPLVWGIWTQPFWGGSIVLLYFTAGPIVVALGYLYEILIKESADDGRIVEIDGNPVSSLSWRNRSSEA